MQKMQRTNRRLCTLKNGKTLIHLGSSFLLPTNKKATATTAADTSCALSHLNPTRRGKDAIVFNPNALSLLKGRLQYYLQTYHKPAKERNKYNCICGSHDALHFNADSSTWHCYSCGNHGDIIALYAADKGLDAKDKGDFVQCVTELASLCGIALDGADAVATPAPIMAKPKEQPEQNYSAFINAAAARLQTLDTPEAQQVRDYLVSRSISRETATKFGLGAAVLHRKTAVIIPNGSSYNARIIDPYKDKGQAKYYRPSGSSVKPLEALQDTQEPQPCWVVEGELDALSIWQAGGNAIATCSANNTKLAIDYARANRNRHSSFVLFFDADEAGQKAAKATLDALQDAEIPCYAWPRANGDTRDANDILRADRANEGIHGRELVRMVEQARRQGTLTADVLARLQQLDGAAAFEATLQRIQEGHYTRCYITPFPQLNNVLYGGFHPGLVILGATTGAGKTTFVLQLASWFAERGERVLYISLEMASVELYTRILSRLAGCVTALGLRAAFDHWQTSDAVQRAISRFKTHIAPRFNVVEGVGSFSANEAAELASYYAKLDGVPPVVVVDYLQMLDSPNPRLTDKQAIDKSILTLKRLSRDLGALVIAISSYNRGAYNADASLSAFKESGSIEYTADLVLALDAKQDAEQNAETRDVTLNCLKNRDGRRFRLQYSYTPAFNLFDEEESVCGSYKAPRRAVRTL